MPQLHLYVSDDIARQLKERARARGLSVSRYLAEVFTQDASKGWPQGYFDQVVGGWQGEPLERPSQGEYENREEL